MARYRLAVRTTGTASGAAAWEIRTASTDRARLLAMGVSLAAATASIFGVGRPAAIGVTPTSPVAFLGEDANEATATVTSALAWGTPPTAPANFLARGALPGAIGNAYTWDFGPYGILIPLSSSIVLWNLQLNSAFDAWALIDE
jgi:hypothetical protein